MDVQKLVHMNGGVGHDSYANNSLIQKSATAQAKSVLEESMKEVYHALKPKCFMMADMGCSSGPNALFAVSEIINAIDDACRSFYKWVEEEKGRNFGPCFVSGTPRSFYGRVFPSCFLHFVYSSCALNWLSQVPEGLVSDQGVALNNRNICITKTSPPEVEKAYYTQFRKDFTLFLRSRATEVVPGGCMVLTFVGAIQSSNPLHMVELLGSTPHGMVLEGMIEEEKLDNFNMHLYAPNAEQVRQLFEAEGSFVLNKFETFTVDWSIHMKQDLDTHAKFLVRFIRATCESVLANAFGEAIIEDLFSKLKTRVLEHIEAGQPIENMKFLLVSATKKIED